MNSNESNTDQEGNKTPFHVKNEQNASPERDGGMDRAIHQAVSAGVENAFRSMRSRQSLGWKGVFMRFDAIATACGGIACIVLGLSYLSPTEEFTLLSVLEPVYEAFGRPGLIVATCSFGCLLLYFARKRWKRTL